MSSQQTFRAGETQGQGRRLDQSTKDTANAAQDKACNAAQSAKESGQQGQEHAAGFIQQTGEQVMNMAHGAMDSVKTTLGVGDHSHKK
ncbi:hypothetical protein IFM89_018662 [Coptis chinensis]|uniref:Uncharacterized protein n=1 Tax=Coptis chinensis TaxID=261450 RepID=A0A835I5Y3_9MAGN|nr:hypothetical protein IFM89_018662 [Coptis chinensis]